MAYIHGKNTLLALDDEELVGVSNSELTLGADSHDTTAYGDNLHQSSTGLGNVTFTCEGTYDNSVDGPPELLTDLWETTTRTGTIDIYPEGATGGKTWIVIGVVLTNYVQTAAVADMVKWSADFNVNTYTRTIVPSS